MQAVCRVLCVLLVMGIVSAAVLIGGCVIVHDSEWCGSEPQHKVVRELATPHQPDSALRVHTGNGAITVYRTEGPEVAIKAELFGPSEERLNEAEIVTDRQADGTLVLDVAWPGGRAKGSEGCSFQIGLPDVRSLDLHSSNGAITCRDLSGKADVQTSNGAITFTQHRGDIQAETTNGAITLKSVSGVIDARTSNGAVNVQLADDSAGPVQIHTSNGAVTLELGKAFAGNLEMSTSNGAINYSGLANVKTLSADRHHVRLSIGDSNQASSVGTSNGAINLRALRP